MFSQHADGDPEGLVDRAHPFGVAAGEVVVDGDDVDALARLLGVGCRGVGGCTASELRTTARVAVRVLPSPVFISEMLALVEGHGADQLDVEVAHRHRPLAGLTDDRETLGQQRVEVLAATGPRSQLVDALAQFGVAVVFELALERVDQGHPLLVALELLRLADVQRAIEQGGHGPRIASAGRGGSQAPTGRGGGAGSN